IYLALGLLLSLKLGGELGNSLTPLADLATHSLNGVSPLSISPFAAVAALGSLLALLAGMSRTAAEMAADGELPRLFASKIRTGAPAIAEILISFLVILLVLSGSILLTIGLSSFAILSYYAIANLAAYRQPAGESSRPKWLNLAGLVLCVGLALSVPPAGLLLGFAILFLALFLRWGLRVLR
ncbi:MAG: amino acid permease, partial [Aquiluna sp.]